MSSKILIFTVAFATGSLLIAQPSASWNQNSAGIPGTNDAAFGWEILKFSTGSENTGTGTWSLRFNQGGSFNTAIGYESLSLNEKGDFNTAMGYGALYNSGCVTCGIGNNNVAAGHSALYNNTSGSENIAIGNSALFTNQVGNRNTALGYRALFSNDSWFGSGGDDNVAIGHNAMEDNTLGIRNTAIGKNALPNNTYGWANTAVGVNALHNSVYTSVSGPDENTAVGYNALHDVVIANQNTAIGQSAQEKNMYGYGNVADGYEAALLNTQGYYGVAVGVWAARDNASGEGNVAIGAEALRDGTSRFNTAIGCLAMSNNLNGGEQLTAFGRSAMVSSQLSSSVICIGYQSDVTGVGNRANALAFGANAVVNVDDKLRFGDAGSGVMRVETQVAVTNVSDGRYKFDVTEDVKGMEFIDILRPVAYDFDHQKFTEFTQPERKTDLTFKFKNNKATPGAPTPEVVEFSISESTAPRMSGFIAQEVEAAAKKTGYEDFDAVNVPQNEKDYYTVGYSIFTVPLVKGVQEQQHMIDLQEITLQSIEEELEEQNNQLAALGQKTADPRTIQTEVNGSTERNDNVFVMSANPNPLTYETMIQYQNLPTFQSATILIRDYNGKTWLTVPVTQQATGSVFVNASSLPAGTYLYSMMLDRTIIGTQRLVIAGK